MNGFERIAKLQIVPDVSRTVVASLDGGSSGRVVLFSFNDLLNNRPPEVTGIEVDGRESIFVDSSTGVHRLYAGGKALQRSEHLLYGADVDDLINENNLPPSEWQELLGDDVFPQHQRDYVPLPPPNSGRVPSFKTLLIDPASGGQTMYTLGSGHTLWESRDGGSRWRRDDTAPGFVTGAWLSPVDGAVYATVSSTPSDFTSGVLWKRATSSGALPGARIVRSDLRVTCQPPAGFTGSITPGSTFPIGNTVLTCSATDVFGNVNTRLFTISVTPRPATNPVPAHNATGVATNTSLTWTAGAGAASHDVYFGTSNPPASRGNQTGTTFTPGPLAANTTYFWRIDEKSAAGGVTTGTVWSFTTIATPPGAATNPMPAHLATAASRSTRLSWSAGSGASSHDVYFGTTSPGTFRGNQTATTFNPGTLAASTTYFWRINEKNAAGTTTGTVWRFTTGTSTLPNAATNPNPANFATDVSPSNPTLSWTGGLGATTHDVYFGTTSPGTFRGNQTGTTFSAGTLTPNTTYFWRIDARNASGVTTGAVWRFTTGFLPLTLQNGWTNAPSATNNAGVAVVSGKVYLRGAISTTGGNGVAFTLPTGFRPSTDVYVPVTLCNASKGRLYIQPNGTTTVHAEGGIWENAQCLTSLDGASFATSASGYTGLTLENGWTHAPFATRNAAVSNINGVIHFQGAIAGGAAGTVFTVPSGFRPSTDVYVPVDLCSATKGRLLIQPSGAVFVGAFGAFSDAQCFVSLEGASYALTSAGYTALTLQNGWVNAPYGTRNAAVRNDGGIVGFQGAISSGSNAPVFTLPAALRPAKDVYVPVDLCNAEKGRILIQPSGSVSVQTISGGFGAAQCFTSLEGALFAR
jgi:hypothetical protein